MTVSGFIAHLIYMFYIGDSNEKLLVSVDGASQAATVMMWCVRAAGAGMRRASRITVRARRLRAFPGSASARSTPRDKPHSIRNPISHFLETLTGEPLPWKKMTKTIQKKLVNKAGAWNKNGPSSGKARRRCSLYILYNDLFCGATLNGLSWGWECWHSAKRRVPY